MAGAYGQVSGDQQPGGQKKKLAVVGGSAVILVAMVVAVAVGVSSRPGAGGSTGTAGVSSEGGAAPTVSTTSKAIQSICQPADYREECESSLQQAAGNTTDPKTLVEAAFNVSIAKIGEVLSHSQTIANAANDPRTKAALDGCKEMLDSATDDLRRTFDKFAGLDISKVDIVIDDLKVWLSGALTYQDSCLDGFENTTGSAAEDMKRAVNGSMTLTVNALAIVDEISTVLGQFKIPFINRRLLSAEEEGTDGDLPAWVASGQRRLLELSPQQIEPNATVAQDGSGTHTTISAALALVPAKNAVPFVIHIKAGTYKEKVEVAKNMTNVMMIGDGPTKTRITGSLNFIDGTMTFHTATVAVVGDGFIGKDLGFENSAGAAKHQAVALRVGADRSVFYNCAMDGYQDTLYAHAHRQFYRDCTITGTIDFIFGDAESIFQNCQMLVRQPMANQQCIVTAQGRKFERESTGIILHNCTISSDPAFPVSKQTNVYLGRPWKVYSRTIIMQSQIDDLINPDGWMPWMGTVGLDTCFYAEVDNRGPGAATEKRVTWPGIKKLTLDDALAYTVSQFIQGDQWLQPSSVPFTTGLLP